jgi:hypothetical protein
VISVEVKWKARGWYIIPSPSNIYFAVQIKIVMNIPPLGPMQFPEKFIMNLRRMKMYNIIALIGKSGAGKDSMM